MKKLTILEFGANWCAPCKKMESMLSEIEKHFGDVVEIKKIDIENDIELTSKYNIRSVPTLLFFKDNVLKEYSVGLTDFEDLKESVGRLI